MNELTKFETTVSGVVGKLTGQRLQVSKRMTQERASSLAASIQDLVIQQAVKKLLTDDHFSICQWDTIVDLLNIYEDGEFHKQLRSLHCVHWKDMDVKLREMVIKGILDTVDVALNQEETIS